jgi:hypothetical protein
MPIHIEINESTISDIRDKVHPKDYNLPISEKELQGRKLL